MKIMKADEAARKSGFGSQNSSVVASESLNAINTAVEKQKELTATVEFRKFKLTKTAIVETANAFKKCGYRVKAQEKNGVVTLSFHWGPPLSNHEVLLP